MAGIQICWRPRQTPLRPVGAAARASAGRMLAKKLLGWPDERLAELQGVAGTGLIIVLGGEPALPWVDGICYLGRDDAAPSLLLPTSPQPSVPISLLERAVIAHVRDSASRTGLPLAILAAPPPIACVAGARVISRDFLQIWLEALSE